MRSIYVVEDGVRGTVLIPGHHLVLQAAINESTPSLGSLGSLHRCNRLVDTGRSSWTNSSCTMPMTKSKRRRGSGRGTGMSRSGQRKGWTLGSWDEIAGAREGVCTARTKMRNTAAGGLGERFARYVEGRRATDRRAIYRIRARDGDATRMRAPWRGGWGIYLFSSDQILVEGPSERRGRVRSRKVSSTGWRSRRLMLNVRHRTEQTKQLP